MKHVSSKRGFTLIELLIVITIIGILAAALLPSILGAPARARDAARKAHLNSIVAALETYNNDNFAYPSPGGVGCIGSAGFTALDSYFQAATPPSDPQGSSAEAIGGCAAGEYYYCERSGNPINYIVASSMEISQHNGKTTNLPGDAGCDGDDNGTINWDTSALAGGEVGIYRIEK